MVIDISKQIAPHFHKTFNSLVVHQIDEGGRASTKTSKNALKVVNHVISDDNCNVVAIRRHKNTLRQSVFAEIKKAFKRLGMREGVHYRAYLSPMRIVYFGNNNTIYFGGLDNYETLKGMIADDNETDQEFSNIPKFKSVQDMLDLFVETGEDDSDEIDESNIKILWLSEITEIREEEDILQSIATFSRGDKDYFLVLYEYNPPKNKYHWVNEWADTMALRSDCIRTHSSYLDVPKKWLGHVFIQQAEELKKNDPERYDHIYLGLVTGLEGLIYNSDLINVIDKLDDDEYVKVIDIFADTGHSKSASTYLNIGFTNKNRIVLLDTYYYSPNGQAVKKAPSELSKDLWEFLQYSCITWRARQDTMIIDSAEGAIRNQFAKDYGIHLKPVNKAKKEDMIDNVESLLATGRFCVLNVPNNQIFLLEHQQYEWKEGSVENRKPEPDKTEKKMKIKYYNSHSKCSPKFYAEHTCDGLQYGVIMNLRKYGLKF